MKSQSVFSKREVYSILSEIDSLKTLKEIKESLNNKIKEFTPTGRGKRANVDFNILQNYIDATYSGDKNQRASQIAEMVASLWNTQGRKENKNASIIGKEFVLRNCVVSQKGNPAKLKMPVEIIRHPRKKKTREIPTTVSD